MDGNGTMDLTRRKMLKAMLAGAALLVVDRWRGVVEPAAAARAPFFAPPFRPRGNRDPRVAFPQSVASGDPTPRGAVLWTRVDPAVAAGIYRRTMDPTFARWLHEQIPGGLDTPEARGELASRSGVVLFEVSRSASFERPDVWGLAPIWGDYDNVVRVDLDGRLQPATTYYYRFITRDGYVSRTGRFKTLPDASAAPGSVRVGVIVCQDFTNGYFHALRFLAGEDVDLVLHLGDYIYEAVGDPLYQNPLPDRKIVLPSRAPKARTLEDYRHLYRTYRSDPDLQHLHERHAVVATWDDHEFANDCYYPAVAPDDSPASDPERRWTANLVWYEYMPARVPFDPNKPFDECIRIHRSFRVGNLAEFFVTDERLYRDAPCDNGLVLDRYLFAQGGCSGLMQKSMLGEAQRQWLLKGLTRSTATWKVWANEVQFVPFKVNPTAGVCLSSDMWDGYEGERQAITDAVLNHPVRNFLLLTGDLHTFEANLVLDRYPLALHGGGCFPPGGFWCGRKLAGVELMTGSVTSTNLREMIADIGLPGFAIPRPTLAPLRPGIDTSAPIPREALEQWLRLVVEEERARQAEKPGAPRPEAVVEPAGLIDLRIRTANGLWMKWYNMETHGYSVLELRRSEAWWFPYGVSSITQREGVTKRLLWAPDGAGLKIAEGRFPRDPDGRDFS